MREVEREWGKGSVNRERGRGRGSRGGDWRRKRGGREEVVEAGNEGEEGESKWRDLEGGR